MSDSAFRRRLPIGAEPADPRTTHVRLWAPRPRRVEVVTAGGVRTALAPDADGYVSATIDARAGDRYQFKIDGDDRLYPDPASRYQPEGPHGPSQIVDPAAFAWTDASWRGVASWRASASR
jgi:maltooligosyltrehalose trehalohydrolase